MKYMGSKNRVSKEIIPIITNNRDNDQWYIEPFCGGCNVIDKVTGNRIGNDIHPQLIALCNALSNGWLPPKIISENEYNRIKENQSEYPQELVGYVGFQLSFGAKWFGGYRRDKTGKRNYSLEAFKNVSKQAKNLYGIKFYNRNYYELDLPKNSIIYCDPPYANTTKYNSGNFDNKRFWDWCDSLVEDGHNVFVSEYLAPNNWVSVWSKEVVTSLDVSSTKKDVERLFVNEKQFEIINMRLKV